MHVYGYGECSDCTIFKCGYGRGSPVAHMLHIDIYFFYMFTLLTLKAIGPIQ